MLKRQRGQASQKNELVFLTLSDRRMISPKGEFVIEKQMELLKRAINEVLFDRDIYTRYGNRHYILLLTDTAEDCGPVVFGKVEKTYRNVLNGKGELWYHTAWL